MLEEIENKYKLGIDPGFYDNLQIR